MCSVLLYMCYDGTAFLWSTSNVLSLYYEWLRREWDYSYSYYNGYRLIFGLKLGHTSVLNCVYRIELIFLNTYYLLFFSESKSETTRSLTGSISAIEVRFPACYTIMGVRLWQTARYLLADVQRLFVGWFGTEKTRESQCFEDLIFSGKRIK